MEDGSSACRFCSVGLSERTPSRVRVPRVYQRGPTGLPTHRSSTENTGANLAGVWLRLRGAEALRGPVHVKSGRRQVQPPRGRAHR